MFALRDKKVLTFDCYGTLIDWETGILTALQPVLRAHGVALDDERVLEQFGEFEAAAEAGPYMSYREVLATCVRAFGEAYQFAPSAAELERFSSSVGDWPAFPDSAEALAALQRCFSLAIISNVDDDLFALSNRRLGVKFDHIITAQQARSYKPSPNNFQLALQRIGVPKEQILHVAQSLFHDHAPAKQLGFDTVWVNRRHDRPGLGATPPADAQPDMEQPDMRGVARALCGPEGAQG
jgi:2-haloacid dehalogenase